MTGQTLIDKMTREDFSKAMNKGFQRRFANWLIRKDNSLLSFEEVHSKSPCKGRHDEGLRTVPIQNIVGSMARCKDFDRAFFPLRRDQMRRWSSIDKAYYHEITLPPIELYKVGDVYFVVDGHHRVSVARSRGQLYIDAHVIEIETQQHMTPTSDVSASV